MAYENPISKDKLLLLRYIIIITKNLLEPMNVVNYKLHTIVLVLSFELSVS